MKSPKEKQRKKCVELAKKIARKRDNNKCVMCGNDGRFKQLHGSHIYPEGLYVAMSADPDNIVMHCAYCHLRKWHEHPVGAHDWFKKKYPELSKKLKKRSLILEVCDIIYWKKKYEKLKKLYSLMK